MRRARQCVEQVKDLTATLVTCWPVLVEAAWLLGQAGPLMQMAVQGKLACLELDAQSFPWIDQYASKYSNLRPQLADMALAYLAERENIRYIFTLDRRDILVYKRSNGRPFELLPSAL
jgi:hypothetical protein